MWRNVVLNQLTSNVEVLELNWFVPIGYSIYLLIDSPKSHSCKIRGEPLPDDIPRPDLILAADCVYFEPAFPLLVQTLSDLSVDEKTEVLFCYKKRRKV